MFWAMRKKSRNALSEAHNEAFSGSFKCEFYSLYDQNNNSQVINDSLQQHLQIYNNYRPHRDADTLLTSYNKTTIINTN